MTDSRSEKLPCPFCESVVIAREGYHMACYRCGAAGPDGDDETDESAITAWNRRAAASMEASRRTERATIQADELDARYGFVTKVARGMALEEAKRACEGEFLHEPQAGTEDIAYDYAVRDCIAAIAALAVETKEG